MPKKKKSKRSPKGALIKEASRPIPIDLILDPVFRQDFHNEIRGAAGVYILYKGRNVYYVGHSNKLFWALHSKTRNKHKNKWNKFAFFRVNNVRFLKDLKSLLIDAALPPGNEVSSRFYRAGDLTRAIQKFSEARRKTANKIVIAMGKSR
jgi:hypothetical protein